MRLIDADALIMALRLEYPMIPMFKENQEEWGIKTEGYRKAEEVIKNAPSIEPKRGEWLWDDGYFCSECHKWAIYDASLEERLFDFCPNCGADMRKESE